MNKTEKRKKAFFVAYPKTCGFAWSCHGSMVFFTNEKYNLKVFDRQPELKKLHEWPNPNTYFDYEGEIVENEGDQFIYPTNKPRSDINSA